MLKEFRSLGVFAAFSRWSLDVSWMQKQVRYYYCLNSHTPKLPHSQTPIIRYFGSFVRNLSMQVMAFSSYLCSGTMTSCA